MGLEQRESWSSSTPGFMERQMLNLNIAPKAVGAVATSAVAVAIAIASGLSASPPSARPFLGHGSGHHAKQYASSHPASPAFPSRSLSLFLTFG